METAAEDPVHFQPTAHSATASTLPPYPELIIAAIDALNDPNGSNKTTISRHIEALYPNLPPSHTTLLSHHLNRMKQNGDLVLVKNNYMKPDSNAPPKRGRGRPRKQTEPVLTGQVAPLPSFAAKPRGRPPKSVDNDAPPKPKPSVSGKKRGRGRPPKNNKAPADASVISASEPPTGAVAVGGVVKRGRGRPPKAKPVSVPVGA